MIVPGKLSDFSEIYIVLEFCESDLKKLLKSSLNLEMLHIETVLWNLLHAIKHIHESKVLHRDLKPGNVLINKDCQIKICDFGLSRTLPESCLGSGSGNTTRVRNSLHRYQLTDDKIRDLIYKKLKSEKESS